MPPRRAWWVETPILQWIGFPWKLISISTGHIVVISRSYRGHIEVKPGSYKVLISFGQFQKIGCFKRQPVLSSDTYLSLRKSQGTLDDNNWLLMVLETLLILLRQSFNKYICIISMILKFKFIKNESTEF